jgi:hypothetical protein
MAVVGVVSRWVIPRQLISIDNSTARVLDVRTNREVR